MISWAEIVCSGLISVSRGGGVKGRRPGLGYDQLVANEETDDDEDNLGNTSHREPMQETA